MKRFLLNNLALKIISLGMARTFQNIKLFSNMTALSHAFTRCQH